MWTGRNAVFRDFLILIAFVCLLASVFPVSEKVESTIALQPPGTVIVEMTWDKAVDADVDLWVQGPGDVPVGYSNKSGIIFNLLRDDLGRSGDPNSMNEEMAIGRGRWPGEYVANVMLYRSRDHKFPVGVDVVAMVQGPSGQMTEAVRRHIELTSQGQEMTAFRFRLDETGSVVADSVNHIFKPLRSEGKQQ